MAFLRIKTIKGNDYAYLVESRWRKKPDSGKPGGRQKVKQYLGRVHEFKAQKQTEFQPEAEYASIKDLLRDLIIWELSQLGFKNDKPYLTKDGFMVNVQDFSIEGKGVIKLNEGYLCQHTLKNLVNFKLTSRNDEYRLARAFIDAGIRIPKELFVEYWQNLIK